MNIRHTILASLATEGATMDDLAEKTGLERKKLHDNMKSCINDGLVSRGRDDVTSLPFYTITAAGRARLSDGPQQGRRAPKNQAVSGANNPGSASSVASSEAPLRLSAEGCAVIEPPKPNEMPVEACSDEIKPPQYDPREVSFSATEREKALLDQRAVLDLALSNSQKQVVDLEIRLGIASAALKQKDDELFKQSQIVANLRRENQALSDALNLAKRRQTSGAGDKYAVLAPNSDLYDTPEEAAKHVSDWVTDSEIEDAQIIAVNPIGRVEVRTVFVPHADNYQEAA